MQYSFTATYKLFSKKVQKNLVRSFSCRTFAADFAPKRGVDKENVLWEIESIDVVQELGKIVPVNKYAQ